MQKFYRLNEQRRRVSRAVARNVLKELVFADSPKNWLVHSQGFYHAGCQLIRVLQGNEEQFSKIIIDEMFFYHRYSYKIAIFLLSHATELLLKASISYYNRNNPANMLDKPASYGHKAKQMFNDLIKVNHIAKNDGDNDLIELMDTFLRWYGRYHSPHEKQIDNSLELDYVKDENETYHFKHDFADVYKKLIHFYQRVRLGIKVGSLDFEYSSQAP